MDSTKKLKFMKKRRRILIMTAVNAEKEAVERGVRNKESIEVCLAGVGPVAAAVNTSQKLSRNPYDLVISTGIAGGFPGQAGLGMIVIAKEIVAADLGVETPEGFGALDQLGLGSTKVPVDRHLAEEVFEVLQTGKIPVAMGPVLTVSTATGSAESALEMTRRVPGAMAEGMEGYGVALAAQAFGVPVLEIRAISNEVGPRDKTAWRIQEALEVLTNAFREIFANSFE